ncbi:hypothetical protein [Armatimonas sp.]
MLQLSHLEVNALLAILLRAPETESTPAALIEVLLHRVLRALSQAMIEA